jgi:hypothetical protein
MPEIADLLPLANPETEIDPVMYSKEDLDLLRVMNRVTAKQKNDARQTLENYAVKMMGDFLKLSKIIKSENDY